MVCSVLETSWYEVSIGIFLHGCVPFTVFQTLLTKSIVLLSSIRTKRHYLVIFNIFFVSLFLFLGPPVRGVNTK